MSILVTKNVEIETLRSETEILRTHAERLK